MARTLLEWQEHLEKHFKDLSDKRKALSWPVFALEHGLLREQVTDLETAVRRSLVDGQSPSRRTALPWIVYAAEFGYSYSGEEYWQSFAAKTPRWNERWRDYIRDVFKEFSRRYYGVQPEGVWAEAFSIIAWPITHGILPRDLQRHLARVLFEARSTLRTELFQSAEALGKHLQSFGHYGSSRFRDFAENELLLGQIAAALLLHEQSGVKLIDESALRRLVDDINRERNAAAWLNEARNSARRLQVKGLSARLGPTVSHSSSTTDGAKKLPTSDPQLILSYAGVNSWNVMVQTPDLSTVIVVQPKLRQFFSDYRGRIVGGEAIARGRLLQRGTQYFALRKFPSFIEPIAVFDNAPPEVTMFVQASFRMLEKDNQLFRILNDGRAVAQRTKVVRPSTSYLLLVDKQEANLPKWLKSVQLNCEGKFAIQLDVPDSIDEALEALLERLTLRPSKLLHVYPVGIPAAAWDGEGKAEWIEGDEAILGIKIDHSISSFQIAIDGLIHKSSHPEKFSGKTTFLSLGRLNRGRHELEIACESTNGEALRGFLQLGIRDSGLSPKNDQHAFVLRMYPPEPSMEEIWENRVDLQLAGPTGADIACTVSLRSRTSSTAVAVKQVPGLKVPLAQEKWKSSFLTHVKKDKVMEARYEEASSCSILFDFGSFGKASVDAIREFTPLRWVMGVRDGKSFIKLIDDSGLEGTLVTRRNLQRPFGVERVAFEDAFNGITIAHPGALLTARTPREITAVVVSPRVSLTFSQLSFPIETKTPRRDVKELIAALEVASEWQVARPKGNHLAELFQRRVVRHILVEILGAICGERWLRLERELEESPEQAERTLSKMFALVKEGIGRRAMADDIAGLVNNIPRSVRATAEQFERILHGVGPTIGFGMVDVSKPNHSRNTVNSVRRGSICEYALRLASSPIDLVNWSENGLESGLKTILERPAIARCARYTVLSVNHQVERIRELTTIYGGWEWQA